MLILFLMLSLASAGDEPHPIEEHHQTQIVREVHFNN
jgi:hypothetical protein